MSSPFAAAVEKVSKCSPDPPRDELTKSKSMPPVPATAIGQIPSKIVLLLNSGLNSISAKSPAVHNAVPSMTVVKKSSKVKWTSVFQKVFLSATTSELSPRVEVAVVLKDDRSAALPFPLSAGPLLNSSSRSRSSSSSSKALRGSVATPAPAGPRTEKRFHETAEVRRMRRELRDLRIAVGIGVNPSPTLLSSIPPSADPPIPENLVPFVKSRKLTPLPPQARMRSRNRRRRATIEPRKRRQARKSQEAQRPMQAAKEAKKASAWSRKTWDSSVSWTVRSVPIDCFESQVIAAV